MSFRIETYRKDRTRAAVPSPCATKHALFFIVLVIAIGGTNSFGAIENDPEGRVERDSDGGFSYFSAAAAASADTPQISHNDVIVHEEDFYDRENGAFWDKTNQESLDRANTGTASSPQQVQTSLGKRKESKNVKSKNQYRIGYLSRNGGVRGGAAGRAYGGGRER